MQNKLIVILGPTASGKTTLAVDLAYKLKAEIISADSRQIYKRMNIGTGKDLAEYKIKNVNIPYHLIDILEPEIDYSVYQFKKDFFKCYNNLLKKGKNIILCGGTGLYIESILLDYKIPNIGPDKTLRGALNKKTMDQLIREIKLINKNSYDKNFHTTQRRLIRTIEILKGEGLNVNNRNDSQVIKDYIVIGMKIDREELLTKIKKRLTKRFDEGMIAEVESLLADGLSKERLKYFGLEYKIIGEYLSNKVEFNLMQDKLTVTLNGMYIASNSLLRRKQA